MSGIASNQNAFKFKISPHWQKSIVKITFWQENGPPGTPKHNGKSGTAVGILLSKCGKFIMAKLKSYLLL